MPVLRPWWLLDGDRLEEPEMPTTPPADLPPLLQLLEPVSTFTWSHSGAPVGGSAKDLDDLHDTRPLPPGVPHDDEPQLVGLPPDVGDLEHAA